MTFFIPLFAFYLPEINEPVVKVGIVISTFALTAILTRPFFAYFIDQGRGRTVLFTGYICLIAGIFCYRFAGSVNGLLPVRVLHGFGYAAVTNSAINVFTKDLDESIRKRGLTYYGLAMVFATSLGPSAGLFFRSLMGTGNAFAAALTIALIGLVCLILARPSEEKPKENKNRFHYFDGYEVSALPLAAFMVIAAMANSAVVTYLGKHAGEIGYPQVGSTFFLIYAIAMVASRKLMDLVVDRFGDIKVLYAAYVGMGLSYALLAAAKTPLVFYMTAVLIGIGFGTVQATLNALILTVCPVNRRGAANSTFQTSLDVGAALGAIVWGYVTDVVSYSKMYLLCILLSAAALAGIWVYSRSLREK